MTTTTETTPPRVGLEGGLIALLYVLGGLLGSRLTSGQATLLWPPAGVALASLVIFGRSYWPVVWASAGTVSFAMGAPILAAPFIGGATTLAAVMGAALLTHMSSFRTRMDRIRDTLDLALVGMLLVPTVGGLLEASVVFVVERPPVFELSQHFASLWLSHATGVLVVAPALFAFLGDRTRKDWSRIWPLEAVTGLSTAFFMAIALFGGRLSLPLAAVLLLLPVPLLLWGAIRFGLQGTSLVTTIVLGIAAWRTVDGFGPFAEGGALVGGYNLPLWGYMMTLGLSGLLMWSLLAEHRRSLVRFRAVFRRLVGRNHHGGERRRRALQPRRRPALQSPEPGRIAGDVVSRALTGETAGPDPFGVGDGASHEGGSCAGVRALRVDAPTARRDSVPCRDRPFTDRGRRGARISGHRS